MMTSSVFAPTSSEASKYHAILQKKIDEGSKRAASVIEMIHTQQPVDVIAPTRALAFAAQAPERNRVQVIVGDAMLSPSDYAIGQLAGRAGVPTQYLREMMTGEGWQRELATRILTDHFGNGKAERVLTRAVNGQLRGVLSDRFRRIDSRPLVDALATVAQGFGAVPVDGVVTETRCALKLLMPQIVEPVPGEYMVYGGEWSNSDYGNGTHSFRSFALRVVCLNGMTRENLLREIHLGGRLSENVSYSDRTHRLDTATSVSALRDVLRGALSPAGIESISEGVRALHAKKMSGAQLMTATKSAGKAAQKAISEAFESLDVINLPAGETAWRASNAVSWVARHTEDAEARLDLERLAGSII